MKKEKRNLKLFILKHSRGIKALSLAAAITALGFATNAINKNDNKNNFNKDKHRVEFEDDTFNPNSEVTLNDGSVLEYQDVIDAIAGVPFYGPLHMVEDVTPEASVSPSPTPAASSNPDTTLEPDAQKTPKPGNGDDDQVSPIPSPNVTPEPSNRPGQPTPKPTIKPATPTPAPTETPHKHKFEEQKPIYISSDNGKHTVVINHVCMEDGFGYSIRRSEDCKTKIIDFNADGEIIVCELCDYETTQNHKMNNGVIDKNNNKKVYSCLNKGCGYKREEKLPDPTPDNTPKPTERPKPTQPPVHVCTQWNVVGFDDDKETLKCPTCGKIKYRDHSTYTETGNWISDGNGKHSRTIKTECSTCNYSKDTNQTLTCSNVDGKCPVCGYTHKQECHHDDPSTLKSVVHPATQDFCAYEDKVCKVCGEIVVTGHPPRHSWQEIGEVVGGEQRYICANCGQEKYVAVSTPTPGPTPEPPVPTPGPTLEPTPTVDPTPTDKPTLPTDPDFEDDFSGAIPTQKPGLDPDPDFDDFEEVIMLSDGIEFVYDRKVGGKTLNLNPKRNR